MSAQPELAKALVAAQAEMPAVGKDGTNPHFGSRFTTLDALITATRPVLVKNGLAIAQFPASDAQGGAVLRTILLHVSGQSLEADTPLFLGKGTMQDLGSAITYARRYGFASVLGIASDEDDDASHTSVASSNGSERASDGRAFNPAEAPAEGPGAYVWPFGKHKGVRLDATERGYMEWFVKNSDKADIVAIVKAHLDGQNGRTLEDAIEAGEIPF